MKTEYKGYSIEVIGNQKDGRWGADVTIIPAIADVRGMRVIGDYKEQAEVAEAAGLTWAKERIDKYSK